VENAAIKEGGHPREITDRNIASIKTDFEKMGFSHDWNREVMSHDPNYFRWNQWFFLKFLEKGLAYRTFANVNWCGPCNTVLANEQVHNGRCWRCSSEVEQRDMDQWFLKITNYAQELLDSLEDISFPNHVKALQRDWMGRSEGALIRFKVDGDDGLEIEAFTTRPDTIFGVTFVTLAPENPLCKDLVSGHENEAEWQQMEKEAKQLSDMDRGMLKEKKGVFLGRYAINPLTGEKIPIYAGNFVIASYGTGSVMAVPGHDQRDFDFAKQHNLPIKKVLNEKGNESSEPLEAAFEGYGEMVNSTREGFDGLSGEEAKRAVIDALENEDTGNGMIQWKIRDWLISRQRYWGTPIPIIHCDGCGMVPVPEEDLPVLLPDDVEFTWEGNPIETSPTFSKVDCPTCGQPARRETDTMDTFVDSSWYFMRYTDARNSEECFSKTASDYWMNVDFYCGGIEHAQMHLIYARFWTKAVRDLGLHQVDEPFQELLCQGMVNAQAPYCKSCNITHPVSERGNNCPHCSAELSERSAKMSKSLGNTVGPVSMIEQYGADTIRLFILFAAQPTAGMDWSDTAVESCYRQMKAIWNLSHEMLSWQNDSAPIDDWLTIQFQERRKQWVNDMEGVDLRASVMLSHYDVYSDLVWYQRRGGKNGPLARSLLLDWAKMLHPATPHLAEELWAAAGGVGLVAAELLNFDDKEGEKGYSGINSVLAEEIFLQSILDQARQMKGLAERHLETEATSATIQCSEAWKGDLVRTGIELLESDFPMKQAMGEIMSRPFAQVGDVRGQVPGAWKRIMKQMYKWSPTEREVLKKNLDEVEILKGATDFLINELGVNELHIYIAGEGEDVGGKAKFSFPAEPGIAYL
jgi:leucyl-tRNA synthetase